MNRLKWFLRRIIYKILDIPDELVESIGGLNWAVEQNTRRINKLSEESADMRYDLFEQINKYDI